MEVIALWSMVSRMRRKKNRYIAALLAELETILPPDGKEYQLVRKLILDFFNDYYRDNAKTILGIDVEGQNYL